MMVNGLQLPPAFVDLHREIYRGRLPDCWRQKSRIDAYGHRWEADLEFHPDLETMAEETARLARAFEPGDGGRNCRFADEPGFIPDIYDFSRILCFGRTGSGEFFCFDFREVPHEPGVIYWEDVYWRRMAPNFETFMALFRNLDEWDGYDDEE